MKERYQHYQHYQHYHTVALQLIHEVHVVVLHSISFSSGAYDKLPEICSFCFVGKLLSPTNQIIPRRDQDNGYIENYFELTDITLKILN